MNARPLVPSWSATPIPHLSLAAGGLVVLADLTTVAQRTVLAGGSSWLDALVLAPGLHYQQAAAALVAAAPAHTDAVDAATRARVPVPNRAVVAFLARLWDDAAAAADADAVTVDVALRADVAPGVEAAQLARAVAGWWRRRQPPADAELTAALQRPPVDVDWLSHAFYLASPLLTVAAVTLMVLLADWWGLAFLAALMTSRVLNIWSIKQRTLPRPPAPAPAPAPDRRTAYAIDLGDSRRAVLRGRASDLRALTAQSWLRPKAALDSYLEAAAKLLVYLVAALSGNLSQAAALVLMALLLASAGLLGLSNAHATALRCNGRVARLAAEHDKREHDASPAYEA